MLLVPTAPVLALAPLIQGWLGLEQALDTAAGSCGYVATGQRVDAKKGGVRA